MKSQKYPYPKIEVGNRIGHLTVERKTKERKGRYIIWLCRCDCGNEILLDTRALRRGTITDCGCLTKVKAKQKDLTGKRFGHLVCIEPTEERCSDGSTIWICRCDCGNLCSAAAAQLSRGYKKSCGCLSHYPLKDYIGKRFGRLVVTGYAGKKDGMHRWQCRCDCGNETVVGQSLLQSGRTKSCGCLRSAMIKENLKLVNGTSVSILEAGKKRLISSNTSGYTGVYQNKRNGHWVAQITFQGKTYYLGSYEKIEDAVEARRKGEEMHNDFLEWYHQTHS
ncbi:MAG: hypothetical protein ACI4V1_08455 [Eubacteriales bacterium]